MLLASNRARPGRVFDWPFSVLPARSTRDAPVLLRKYLKSLYIIGDYATFGAESRTQDIDFYLRRNQAGG